MHSPHQQGALRFARGCFDRCGVPEVSTVPPTVQEGPNMKVVSAGSGLDGAGSVRCSCEQWVTYPTPFNHFGEVCDILFAHGAVNSYLPFA